MRKMLDKTSKGEVWMEIAANLTLYHVVEDNGAHHVTTNPSEARKLWRRIAGGAEKEGASV